MKQILALICLAIIVSQGAVYSAAIEKVTEERGYISSSAEKYKDVYPNVAEISFTKETTEKTIELASTKNKEVMAEITKSLQAYKNDNTEIRTGNYSANPNYTYNKSRRRQSRLIVLLLPK